ncbi:MAG: bacterial proteasome activator family protein [Nocardioidaceae bacterium]
MTSDQPEADAQSGPQGGGDPRVIVIAPDQPVVEGGDSEQEGLRSVADLVEHPDKVMRIGSMIRQLLEEVKSAPLDEASRVRLREIHKASIKELETGLAPQLVEELERLNLPFAETTPSEGELRIAQAQLVGWLEGLFHGIQTTIYAQQMAARAQLEQMRRALPAGMTTGPDGQPQPGMGQEGPDRGNQSNGMYL